MTLPMTLGGGVPNAGYQIANSIRLDGTAAYLSKTLTTSTTTSGVICVKRGKLGVTQPILDNKIYFNSSDQLMAFGLTTTKVYREPDCWIFLFWNGTGIYDKGTLLTGTGTYTPAAITNPRLGFDGTNYFSGSLANFCFWNGSSVSYQGTSVDANGQTVAARPTGTATSYSFLEFKNSGALGTDTSGNGNAWTVTGSPVQTTDTPTNNFCTLNPLWRQFNTTGTYSNGNLSHSGSGVDTQGTFFVSSGKWYFEATVTAKTGGITIGICDFQGEMSGSASPNNVTRGYNSAANKISGTTSTAYGAAYTIGDVIGCEFDIGGGTIEFFKNGTSQGVAFSDIAGITWTPSAYYGSGVALTWNFGATSFARTPNAGFKALCTANLPAVAIPQPKKHFDVNLRSGTGATANVTGKLFQPDLSWTKPRNAAADGRHCIYDSVRGANKRLSSNNTNAEATDTDCLMSFNSDGVTFGSDAANSLVNHTGDNYVDWFWKAGGAAVTNNAGSISAQVSVNATAGMSVGTWTGTGANATVGHGLGAIPKLVIVKKRNAATGSGFIVYHAALAATDYILLSSAAAKGTAANVWNSAAPTSTVINLGNETSVNNAGDTYVAYVFTDISGYSKFGSYTGNGDAGGDGPFVYCGFRPKYLLVKRTDAAEDWNIADASRSPNNQSVNTLYADSSAAEMSGSAYFNVDFTSTGFKIRSTGSGNGNASAKPYIFAAFAEFPFGGSNVAPCPAR